MKTIYISNDSVIYMGVTYNKDQWEVKLKEIKERRIKNLIEKCMKDKKCSKCKKIKPLIDFYPDKIKKDNLSSYCKSCCLERDSSPEVKEYKKKYWKREEVLENKRKNYLKPETQKKKEKFTY